MSKDFDVDDIDYNKMKKHAGSLDKILDFVKDHKIYTVILIILISMGAGKIAKQFYKRRDN